MPKKTYFRTLVTVEILSNEPIEFGGPLEEIAYNIREGPWSGQVTYTPSEKIKAPKARRLLQKQGSDPNFLDNPS